jgi:hypothetical protein
MLYIAYILALFLKSTSNSSLRFLEIALPPIGGRRWWGSKAKSHTQSLFPVPHSLFPFTSRPLKLPKLTILIDNGYHPEKLKTELEKIYPAIMSKIQFELSPKLSKASKQAQGQSGFIPIKARWVIERSNSWMERCKSLVKNFERTLTHATTKINLCFVRLMLKRLAAPY